MDASAALPSPLSTLPPSASPAAPLQTVWETDAAGMNLYQSPSWYHYVGEGPGSSFGEDWLRFYHPDDREHLVREWQRARDTAGEHRYDIEARVRRHDGAYRWFRIQGVPLKARDGRVVKWTGTCTDIHHTRRDAAVQEAPAPAVQARPRPRRAWRLDPLERRLFLLVLLGLLPLALLSFATLIYSAQRQQQQLQEASDSMIRAIVTAVDTELSMSQAALQALAASPRLAAGDLAGFRQEAHELLQRRPGWANVVLSTPQAQQLVNARMQAGTPLPARVAPELMALTAASGRPQVGRLVYSPVLQELAFAVAVPVLRDGQATQVLTAVMTPSAVQQVLTRQSLPHGALVAVLDGHDNVVARSLNPREWVGKPASGELLALLRTPGDSGSGITHTLEGRPVYTVFHRSAVTGWSAAIGIPTETLDAPVRRSYLVLGGATLASVLAGLVAAGLIARTITRPMRELERAAAEVALGRSPPVPATDLPEIRQAGFALFNAHAEREKLLESEREARLLAEKTNRAKDEFLAMLGHELRNPLAALSTASQILDRQPRAEVAEQARGIVRRQIQQITRLTDDLLDAGRVVVGKIALQRRPIDLAACVGAVVDAMRDTGPLAAHRLGTSLSPVWVNADPQRIEQVVTNLLVNAGKYTPPPGEIHVQVAREGSEAVLRVRDSGLGLEPELKGRVFDLFVQGRSAEGRAQGGLGVGLTLVRGLTELHGGRVEAISDGPGRGSEFVVRLPLGEAPGPCPT